MRFSMEQKNDRVNNNDGAQEGKNSAPLFKKKTVRKNALEIISFERREKK